MGEIIGGALPFHGREEVDSDRPDDWGRTPLSYATSFRQASVMKILLGREEANPDRPDNHGRTPLWYAAEIGFGSDRIEEVVKILLGRAEVNPNKPDNAGRTPLSRAASKGNITVVKILIEREEVTPISQIITTEHRSRIPLGVGIVGITSMLVVDFRKW